MHFILQADAVFEADDLDDAFRQLANYFIDLEDGAPSSEGLVTSGSIEVKPLKGSEDARPPTS